MPPSKSPGEPTAVEEADRRGDVRPPVEEIQSALAAGRSAAQWLLGVAAAYLAFVLGGLQLTQVADAPGGRFFASAMTILAAVVGASLVVRAAIRTMTVPFTQLHDLLVVRGVQQAPGRWQRAKAALRLPDGDLLAGRGIQPLRSSTDRLVQALSEHSTVEQLEHDLSQARLTALRPLQTSGSDSGNDRAQLRARMDRLETLGQAVVAQANHVVHRRRLGELAGMAFLGAILFAVSTLAFVRATRPADELPMEAPTGVMLIRVNDAWPEPLEACEADTLTAVAVAGAWPSPSVAVPAQEGCSATTLTEDRHLSSVVILPELPEE